MYSLSPHILVYDVNHLKGALIDVYALAEGLTGGILAFVLFSSCYSNSIEEGVRYFLRGTLASYLFG